jgi:hypothetical protein
MALDAARIQAPTSWLSIYQNGPATPRFIDEDTRTAEQVNGTATGPPLTSFIYAENVRLCLTRKRQSAPTHILVSCRANRIWVRPHPPPRTKAHGRRREPLGCPCCLPLPPARSSADIRPQDLPQLKQRSRLMIWSSMINGSISTNQMKQG